LEEIKDALNAEESTVDEVFEDLVSQYADNTAFLWSRRDRATHAANTNLSDLAEIDERLAAHIEGLHVSGISGWHHCEKALESQEPGETFAAAVLALETCDSKRMEKVLASVERAPETMSGLTSALGWVDPAALKATVSSLLRSQSPLQRRVALAACAMHRVDPGLASARRLEDPSPLARSRALRAVGELGQVELLATCVGALADKDPECQFWAGWSSVMLGDRGEALDALSRPRIDNSALRLRSYQLTVQAMGVTASHEWLKKLASDRKKLRLLIQSCGIAGNAEYVPWLIDHIADEKSARLAGEAFCLVTGADLSKIKLDRPQPENFESGPNDNPDDPNVDMDPDEGLPWPDPDKIEKWWAANASRFHKGTRYFMGAPVTREHCIDVLKNGYQRQRILAAHYLCLLDPGTPLFNTSAPAWRQQRLLARM
jgi:uncharacterized protein (TIGR02270 family)